MKYADFTERCKEEAALEAKRKEILRKEGISFFCYPDDLQGFSDSGRGVVLVTRGFSSILLTGETRVYKDSKIAMAWFRSKEEKQAIVWKIVSLSKWPGSAQQTRMFNVVFDGVIDL